MYRLLVVDDEDFITDSLALMLENLQDPVFEVSRAYSAIEALELLNRHVFEIVVTDIQMPGMTGIELLKVIHTKWPLCQVIFLTGYDEFDYAYQALKYNAFRFILKNEGDEILVEALQECVTKITKTNLVQLPTSEETPVSPPAHMPEKQHFLHSLLLGGTQTPSLLNEEIARLKLVLKTNTALFMMICRIDKPLNEQILSSIAWVFKNRAGHAVRGEAVKVDSELALWLMQPVEGGNEEHSRAAITGLAEIIQDDCYAALGLRPTFVFDPVPVNWQELPSRFAHMHHIISHHLQANSGIAMAKIAYFTGGSILSPLEAKEKANQAKNSSTPDSSTFFIEQLMQYIRNNLGADLSLTALSDQVYLNPAYLSRRFKELTGGNITETIVRLRMEEAMRRLRQSTQKIGKISALVGYESAAHFSRVFKRFNNITPQEYRDRFWQVNPPNE